VPGFMLFATANGIHLAGRSCLSPALRNRLLHASIGEYDKEDLVKIIKNKYQKYVG
jgi:midasin (ATPase involved in ribosome maturation)